MGTARSVDPRVLDAGLALALTAWALAEPGTFSDPGRAVVLVGMPVAIAWRRQAPVAVLVVEIAGLALEPRALAAPQAIALFIAAYSAALYSDRRVLVPALLLVAATAGSASAGSLPVARWLLPFVLLGPVWLAGSALRRREQRAEASAERADRLEREQEAALRAERARIARELHDLVTHSVSVMVLQTGAAREIMSRDEHRSRALLESVETSGRSALEELRHMLGLLADQDGDAPLSPQPGVTEIPTLIEQVRQAGVAVELCVEGQPRVVSGGVAVAAYRIVQEALTNVLKHAGGAPSQVVVRWADSALELEIIDHGPPNDGAQRDAPVGRGIAGMRERAAMYGGTLDAGRPRPRLRGPRPVTAGVDRRMSLRVLIADDDALARAALRTIFDAHDDLELVAEAEDGLQAVEHAERLHPDVVLLDIRMPNLDGLEAARQILDSPSNRARVIMLTTFDLDEYVYDALKAGASGFLRKDAPPARLLAFVRSASEGDALLDPPITRRLVERYTQPYTPGTPATGKLAELTPRELEVLTHVARGRSNSEIAAEMYLSEATVKTHVSRILAKLDLRDRVQAVVLAYEEGLVQPGAIDG